MKYNTLTVVAFACLASANVQKRQDIDFSAYAAQPTLPDVAAPVGFVSATTASYDATAVASSAAADITTALSVSAALKKRVVAPSSCTSNPAGTGPTASPDTPSGFISYSAFQAAATGAATPVGYKNVLTNGAGSVQDSTYMTYKMLDSYDPLACAEFCQANQGCNTFNVFFERDPATIPSPSCSDNPPSTTYIKCSIFGGVLGASSATNTGQWQDQFQVVITGSNVYQATEPAAIDGFTGPVNFGTSTINAPSGYMGVQTFPQSQPYDPSVCAAACNAKTAFDVQQGLPSKENPDRCEFFVAYILYENGNNGVFTCTYYTSSWDSSYATNNGQYDGQGNHYTIGYSHGYAKDGAPVNGKSTTTTSAPTPFTTTCSSNQKRTCGRCLCGVNSDNTGRAECAGRAAFRLSGSPVCQTGADCTPFIGAGSFCVYDSYGFGAVGHVLCVPAAGKCPSSAGLAKRSLERGYETVARSKRQTMPQNVTFETLGNGVTMATIAE